MEYVKDFGAIIALVIYYTYTEYKKLKKRQSKAKGFIDATYLSIEINRILKEIRIYTGANRVHIMTFHNTVESLRGKCYYYMDMRYEDVDDHTKPLIIQYQNLPCSQFADTQAKIHQEGIIYIAEDDKTKIGKYHQALGVKSAYKFRLGNSIANGVLALTWYEAGKRLTEKQKSYIFNKLVELETILKL